MSDAIKVLFICVHNAARSRMAEALLRARGGGRFEVTSAGYEPREVNPIVIEAMKSIGVKMTATGPQPSVFDLFKEGRIFNYVISVCDAEHDQKCPIFAGVTQRLSWSFPDPSGFGGTYEEKLARVAEVRDAIGERIDAWLKTVTKDAKDTREWLT
jgi:arsenate reductase (thioredoxin)